MPLLEIRTYELDGERYEVSGQAPFQAVVTEGFWQIVDRDGNPSVRRLNGPLGMAGNAEAGAIAKELAESLNRKLAPLHVIPLRA